MPDSTFGTATYYETYISVDFRWLIVPILPIALALVFLVAVVAESRSRHIPVWKDDQTAALLAIEPETRGRMEQLDAAQMRDVPVVFEHEGRRSWQLRGPAEPGWWVKEFKKVV